MSAPAWTKLNGTALWEDARARHDADDWRRYHAFSHPLGMYEMADRLGVEYCHSLDLAILAHDVVLTGAEPELASWEWLKMRQRTPDLKAQGLIMSTKEHRPGVDNRLLVLDLAGFLCDDVRRKNTESLREEKRLEAGWDSEAFNERTHAYLTGLARRIQQGLEGGSATGSEASILSRIHDGIQKTVSELHVTEGPHP